MCSASLPLFLVRKSLFLRKTIPWDLDGVIPLFHFHGWPALTGRGVTQGSPTQRLATCPWPQLLFVDRYVIGAVSFSGFCQAVPGEEDGHLNTFNTYSSKNFNVNKSCSQSSLVLAGGGEGWPVWLEFLLQLKVTVNRIQQKHSIL